MKSISNFFDTSDYLPILNGSIGAELVILIILYYTPYFQSNFLKKWYETYRLSAVIADVLILVIGIILARLVFTHFKLSWNLYKFIGVILIIQIIHDILFYLFFTSVPRGYNKMLDLFKDYAKEVGYKAILGDSFMLVVAVLFSYCFANLTFNNNIIILITLTYLIPYIIHTK
tara:strand:- start:3057 stop:3575 length:519 start_codon:yes stop_codon:yes gene_type:complete